MTQEKIPITVARGDGIGPEIMEATLKILDAAPSLLPTIKRASAYPSQNSPV